METVQFKDLEISSANEKIENFDFEEILEITYDSKQTFKEKEIVFKNCLFRKGIFFNLNLQYAKFNSVKITFQNCILEENKVDQRISGDNPNKLQLIFLSCFIKDLKLKNSTFQFLLFSKCILYSRLLIENSKSKVITVRNCVGRIFLLQNIKTKVLISYADDNLFIEDSILRTLNKKIIKENKIPRIFSYKTRIDVSGAQTINCEFKKDKKEGIHRENKIEQEGIEPKYHFRNSDFDLLNISLNINAQFDYLKSVDINQAIFQDLTIKGDTEATIDIRHSRANRVFIDKLSAKKLRFYDFSSRLKDSKFEIKNSDLNNTWFDKVQFKDFEILSIYRSTIQNTKFSATEFPNEIEALENIHYPEQKENEYYKNQYENYKQLKIALSQEKNQIQALQMHSKMYSSIRKSTNLSSQDKFILFLNEISNQHGTSISNAFLCFVISLILLFLLYNISLPNAPYQIGWENFEEFWETSKATISFIFENWKNLFTLANPTHRVNQLVANNQDHYLSFANYFISFFSRIIIGWSLYQFITAFRKFGKNV